MVHNLVIHSPIPTYLFMSQSVFAFCVPYLVRTSTESRQLPVRTLFGLGQPAVAVLLFSFFRSSPFWFSICRSSPAFDAAHGQIRVSFNAVLFPKVASLVGGFGSSIKPLYVDGISVYTLDRASDREDFGE